RAARQAVRRRLPCGSLGRIMLFKKIPLLALVLIAACAGTPADDLGRIENIVVIYAENRSFDHLYGLFPGADGIAQATAEQKTQVDHDGKPFRTLPPVWKPGTREPDPRFPRELANGPSRLDAPPSHLTPSMQL